MNKKTNNNTNKQKFTIPVVRIGYGFANIDVEAHTENKAEQLALDEAGNYEFSEKNADYELEDKGNSKFSQKDLIKIYHEINAECISQTENVSMTTIRNILTKYGINAEELY